MYTIQLCDKERTKDVYMYKITTITRKRYSVGLADSAARGIVAS